MDEQTEVVCGSGNVFADLGHPDAALKRQKSLLISAFGRLIKERGLTQKQAAALLGEDQSNLSKILRGHLGLVSSDRLMLWINKLGSNVEIRISPCPVEQRPGVSVEVGLPFAGTLTALEIGSADLGKTL